jgi:hypothetical protein
LLHPDVTFIGPDGKFGSKADDLALHAAGDIRITSVDREPVVAYVTGSVGCHPLTLPYDRHLQGRAVRQRHGVHAGVVPQR